MNNICDGIGSGTDYTLVFMSKTAYLNIIMADEIFSVTCSLQRPLSLTAPRPMWRCY